MKFRSVLLIVISGLGLLYLLLLQYYTSPHRSSEVLPLALEAQTLRKTPVQSTIDHRPPHLIPPKDWYEQLINNLKGQKLLKENILSKEFVWKHHKIDESLYDQRRHALIYLGWVAFWNMETYAMAGGPAGEFIIWGDFVTALAALGYQLTFVNKMLDLWIYLKADPNKYDIIVTDYDGLGTAENIGHFPLHHCRYFLIDGFGTQEQFNSKRHLDLKRILTPYPFDGSNSAINLVTSLLPYHLWSERKMQGVLWAKDPAFLADHLDTILFLTRHLKITLVTTFRSNIADRVAVNALNTIKSYPNITFLPFLNRVQYLQLLSASMFLIGFGRPLDGPTPLEAMAHGCSFINPVFVTPFVHKNKPTRYEYRSQHPFIERHVPEPHAFTIDIRNKTALTETVRKIAHRYQERERLERLGQGLKRSFNHSPDDISESPSTGSYRHPWHEPKQYVQNIHDILARNSEGNCLAKYSGEEIAMPTGHPGNKVFESFTDFLANNCQGGCQGSWRSIDPSSRELLHRLMNESQRLKVLLREYE
jgi:hypothetical protein